MRVKRALFILKFYHKKVFVEEKYFTNLDHDMAPKKMPTPTPIKSEPRAPAGLAGAAAAAAGGSSSTGKRASSELFPKDLPSQTCKAAKAGARKDMKDVVVTSEMMFHTRPDGTKAAKAWCQRVSVLNGFTIVAIVQAMLLALDSSLFERMRFDKATESWAFLAATAVVSAKFLQIVRQACAESKPVRGLNAIGMTEFPTDQTPSVHLKVYILIADDDR